MNALRGKTLLQLGLGLLLAASTNAQPRAASIDIRGHHLTLHLYGKPDGAPVVVSSGDGGWVHLAPSVAETLSSRGFFVVGFDTKEYLESFTDGDHTLTEEDVPGDYRALVDFASRSSPSPPILIGVSEGAGLSVLAATTKENRDRLAGVIGLGLPDVSELGWRFRDSIIYITKKVPNEPTFSVESIIAKMSPLPLAAIHSTHDEFAPLSKVREMMDQAQDPKKLWVIDAPNHRFSGHEDELTQRLLEAIEWVRVSRTQSGSPFEVADVKRLEKKSLP